MNIFTCEARDLPDLWFQLLAGITEHGRPRIVDKGSYEGEKRLEFDYVLAKITHPNTEPLLPDIPPAIGIPNPVEHGYIYGSDDYERSYISYLMSGEKQQNESYTYGERLAKVPIENLLDTDFGTTDVSEILNPIDKVQPGAKYYKEDGVLYMNQIELLIDTYKRFGYNNNQMTLQVAQPSDMLLVDPPCLRQIDTRIQDNGNGPELSFHIYFRSWELWNGLPANLAGIVNVARYIADALDIPNDNIRNFTVSSKGLHLYGYAEEMARLRCMK